MSMAQLIQGQTQRSKKRPKMKHCKPVAFVRFNVCRGKAKPQTIVALLDSGGAESVNTKELTTKLKLRPVAGKPKVWSTLAGDVTTNLKTKSQFTLPELHEDQLEWDFHVAESVGRMM